MVLYAMYFATNAAAQDSPTRSALPEIRPGLSFHPLKSVKIRGHAFSYPDNLPYPRPTPFSSEPSGLGV
jgi:hypothetical protein